MQFKRRCVHLIVLLVAYGSLILVARWTFFTQMWTVMADEPNVDGNHAHALNLDFTVPKRTQRHVKEADIEFQDLKPGKNTHQSWIKPKFSRVLRSDHIARVSKRHQLLQNIFTNFLHP